MIKRLSVDRNNTKRCRECNSFPEVITTKVEDNMDAYKLACKCGAEPETWAFSIEEATTIWDDKQYKN